MDHRVAGARGGQLPSRPDRIRAGKGTACGRDRLCGGGALETARPGGDRIKTDARDAAHLARLLHLGQIVDVTIPTVEQEAARDVVRAREDCRRDLLAARQRISKLLLRQGSSTPVGRHGPVSTNCGYKRSALRPHHCSGPMTPR